MAKRLPFVADPRGMFDALKIRVTDAMKSVFPIIGKKNTLELESVQFDQEPDLRDVEAQLNARLNDETWGVPIVGRFKLRDSVTGKVKSRGTVPLATLPVVTSARGYLVDGKEYYVDHLWRGKSGVFTYPKTNTVVSSITTQERGLNIEFNPKSREFKLRTGGSTVPLTPVLNAMGVSNSAISKAWGPEITKANQVTERKAQSALVRLGRALGHSADPNQIRETLSALSVDPAVTLATLGKGHKQVTPDLLMAATRKVLGVSRGKIEPDDRDSLRYKDLLGLDDSLVFAIDRYGKNKARSLKNSVDRHDRVDMAFRPGFFQWPVRNFFSSSPLSQLGEQTNPIDMLRASTRSTILGESGSAQALEHSDARSVNPSHVGFVDPLDTPEGQNVGINLQMALGLMKDGTTPKTLLFNRRTGKHEAVDPTIFETSTIAMPDQFRKEKGKWVPTGKKVRVSGPGNRFLRVDPDKVDYIIPNPNLMFGFGSSLVPFVQNVNPARIEMASRHLSQAIPLDAREAPLVQVATDSGRKTSVEETIAKDTLPLAPVAGRVTSVKDGEVRIKGKDGRIRTVKLYQNYPLTGKREMIHEEAIVKPGQVVKEGQPLADSGFTRGGVLALGTNLKTALIAVPGKTYEDAIIVSESAAIKLTSQHLHKVNVSPDDQEIVDPKRFQAYYPTAFEKDRYKSIASDGVVRPGTILRPGDPILLGLRPVEHTNEALAMKRMHRSLAKPYKNAAVTWDQETSGEVVRVHRTPDGTVKVHVRTHEPLQVGDKLVSRYGIKGVAVEVRPDAEMPRTKDGPIEVAINPHSIAARVSVGQVYELAAAKVAKKTGQTVRVPNFQHDVDYRDWTQKLMTDAGVDEEEEITDPVTGRMLGKGTVGPVYILKQRHQVERKMTARAGGPGFAYDINRQPKGGSAGGGQSIGGLGNMALLAHGAREILKESRTQKADADNADELWRSIQLGQPIPPPKLTFAHRKFEEYLKGLGVRMDKKGTRIKLIPMIDQEVLAASHGELTRPGLMLKANDLKPEKGGLFDPDVTGGIQGEHPSHITLAEAMPNPFLERGVLALTGLKQRELHEVLAGKTGLSASGKLMDRKNPDALTGGKAISAVLSGIDVKAELKELKGRIGQLEGQALDKVARRYRYLEALQKAKQTPEQAYMTKHLYVLPPSMRPLSVLPSGALIRDSLNELYKGVGVVNEQLKAVDPDLPESRKGRLRFALYQSLGSVAGVMDPVKTTQGVEQRGIMDSLAGVGSPKWSWAQAKLLKGKQDLSARSIIVPDPDLTMDEIGIPQPIAKTIFRPFVVRELTRMGHGALQAQEMVKVDDPLAMRALDRVMEERPVLMKRDPVLHKYGVQAFRAHLVGGRAIHIPNLITEGLGGDFDGNCCVGSSKVALTFAIRGRTVDSASAKQLVEEVYDMRFVGETRVLVVGDDRVTLEMEIRDVPYLRETRRKDKNGASVYQVPDGIRVLSIDLNGAGSSFEPVDMFTVEENATVVRVQTRKGYEVVASDNESLCVYNSATGAIEKRAPKDSIGCLVPIAAKMPVLGQDQDFEYGWMLGAFASDGFLMGDTKSFGYSKLSDVHRERFSRAVDAYEGCPAKRNTYRQPAGSSGKLGGSAKDHFRRAPRCLELFRSFYVEKGEEEEGRAALRKRLPELAHLSEQALLGILTGLLDGDGSVSIGYAKAKPAVLVNFSTSSPYLVRSIKNLCLLLGVRCSSSSYEPKEGRLQTHTAYVISFGLVDIRRLAPRLQLVNPAKREVLEGLVQREMKDDRDIVPIPESLVVEAASSAGPLAGMPAQRTLATMRSRMRPNYRISRKAAREIAPRLSGSAVGAWRNLIGNETVHWDVVKTVEPAGCEKVYDLMVPTTKVFAVNGGLIIWDTTSLYVPVSGKAVEEARRMFPSENLLNPATGKPVYTPKNEMAVGLFRLSQFGKDAGKTYTSLAKAVQDAGKGNLEMTDVVGIGDKKTTPGRLLVYQSLPPAARDPRILFDPDFELNRANVEKLLTVVAKKDRKAYVDTAQALTHLGNAAVYENLLSLSFRDLKVDKELRDRHIHAGERKARAILASSDPDREQKAVDSWAQTGKDMSDENAKNAKASGNRLHLMTQSGVKPTPTQFQEMTLAPILMSDAKGNPILDPVTRSYSEGLDASGYWLAAIGARTGLIQTATSVQQPGYMNKQMVNTVGNAVVVSDKMPERGISMDLDHPDVEDRYLVEPVKTGKFTIKKGTLLTSEIVDRLKNARIRKVVVASPLTSPHGEGLSSKSFGLMPDGRLPQVGDNLGVMAGQSIGERMTQLMLASKHRAGIVGGRDGVQAGGAAMVRVRQLLQVPEEIANPATLITADGKISRIQKDPAGGQRITVTTSRGSDVEHYIPATRKPLPDMMVGATVRKGKPISDGNVNLRELLDVGGLDQVRKQIVTELDGIFGPYGIRRRNLELLARGITNTGVITDPGDAPDFIKGQYVALSRMEEINAQLKGKKPIKVNPVLTGIKQAPLANTEDWAAKLNHERVSDTLTEASLRGQEADISGYNPFAALLFNPRFGEGISGKPGAY